MLIKLLKKAYHRFLAKKSLEQTLGVQVIEHYNLPDEEMDYLFNRSGCLEYIEELVKKGHVIEIKFDSGNYLLKCDEGETYSNKNIVMAILEMDRHVWKLDKENKKDFVSAQPLE